MQFTESNKQERNIMGIRAGRWAKVLVFVCFASTAFAGQSVVLNNLSSSVIPSPNLGAAEQAWRLEWQWHDMQMPDGNVIAWLRFSNLGFYLNVFTPNTSPMGLVQVISVGGKDGLSPQNLNWGLRSSGLFRIQRDPVQKRWSFEAWDLDGTNYQVAVFNIATPTSTSGTNTDLKPLPVSLGFLRIFDNAVPLNSRPPTTAAGGNVAEWKFDGDFKDSAPGGLGSMMLTGAGFVPTPSQNLVSAVAQTTNTPFWAPFRPLRAGVDEDENRLDGTRSFSMADDSDEVTCSWQQLDGPSPVLWEDRESCAPKVGGLLFGSYRFRMVARDVNGVEGVTEFETGAVAHDDNGVVIYPDDRLYDLLGPTVVLGKNPWEWTDSQHVRMAQANWENYSINGGSWESEFNPPDRTLNGIPREGVVWVDRDAKKVYGHGTNFLRVFSAGRPGPRLQVGTVAYILPEFARARTNERTMFRVLRVNEVISDTELDINGSEISLAEADAVPWATWRLSNVVEGATGTVYADPTVNNRKVYGVGTNFRSEFCGGVAGPATSTLQRILIADQLVSLRYRVASCESDTELTLFEDWTGAAISSPGAPWRRQDAVDRGEWSTHNGPASFVNFYDVAAALYSLYYRTGWQKALDAARFISERHWKQWARTWRNAAYLGSIISFEIDSGYASSMKTAEDRDIFWRMAHRDLFEAEWRNECIKDRIDDVRESAYCFEAISFFARYSPDHAQRTLAKEKLVAAYDNAVATHLHETGAILMNSTFQDGAEARWWQLSNGSATAMIAGGEAITGDYCGNTSTFYSLGSLEVGGDTRRDVTLTGGDWTGQGGKRIFLRGTLNGQPFSQANVLESSPTPGPNGGRLRFTWPGDGNPAVYRLQENTGHRSLFTFWVNEAGEGIGPRVMDPDYWHWCSVDSPTQLTLDRPWEGPTSLRRIRFHHTGTRASSLMYGIFGMAMYRVADVLQEYDAEAAAKYRTAGREQMRFLEQTQTQYTGTATLPYFPMHAQICEPRAVWPNTCFNTASNWNVNVMRAFGNETMRMISMQYLRTMDSVDKTRGDAWATALFARTGFASPFEGDGHWSATVDDPNWQSGFVQLTKNFGQAYGQGGSQMWAAAREGGVSRPALVASSIPFDAMVAPTAATYRVHVLFPSGEKRTTDCAGSPCVVQLDARQGTHWIRKEWLDAEGKVLRRADPEPVVIRLPQSTE